MSTRFMSLEESEATRFFRAAINYLELIPERLTFEHAPAVPDVAELVVRLTPQTCDDTSSSTCGTEQVGVTATLEVRLDPKQHCREPFSHWIGNTHRVYPLPSVRFSDLEMPPCYGSGPSATGDPRSEVSRRLGELSAQLRRASKRERDGQTLRCIDRLPKGLSRPDEIASLLDEARRIIVFSIASDTEFPEDAR